MAEIWRRVLGFYTMARPNEPPGQQLQHIAVLMDCSHEVPVGHGQTPGRLRCTECENTEAIKEGPHV